MKYLWLLLLPSLAFGQAGIRRTPLTTNAVVDSFTNATSGQSVVLHIAGGITTISNATITGSAGGGATNAVTSINGQTNGLAFISFKTNSIAVPTVSTNAGTNFFESGYAAAAVSGILHSNDFQNLIFASEIDTVAELNTILSSSLVTSNEMRRGNFVVVDPTYGNNTTGIRGSTMFPFLGITNAVFAAQYGDWVYLRAGQHFSPTNTYTLAKPGINYFFEGGAKLAIGNAADGSVRYAWSDAFGATTNYVYGFGEITVSNAQTELVYIQNAATYISFHCVSAYRTHASSGTAVFRQAEGTLDVGVRDFVRNDGYDGYWRDVGTSAKVHFVAGKIQAADTAIEITEDFYNPGGGYFRVDQIERVTPSLSANFMQLSGNATYVLGSIIGDTNAAIGTGTHTVSDATPPLLIANFISCSNNNASILIDNGDPLTIAGATIVGATNRVPISVGSGATLTLFNCDVQAGAFASHSITSGAPVTVTLAGGTSVNKPVSANVTLAGGRRVSYGTTAAGQVEYFHDANTKTNLAVSALGLQGASSTLTNIANSGAITNVYSSSTAFTALTNGIQNGRANFKSVSVSGSLTLTDNGTNVVFGSSAGGGNVVGPPSSTALTLAPYTDTTGALLTNSSIATDAGRTNLSIPGRTTTREFISTNWWRNIGNGTNEGAFRMGSTFSSAGAGNVTGGLVVNGGDIETDSNASVGGKVTTSGVYNNTFSTTIGATTNTTQITSNSFLNLGWTTHRDVSTNWGTLYQSNSIVVRGSSGPASVLFAGTTSGSTELSTAATGQTNFFIFDFVAPVAGQVVAFDSITTAGGTNVIRGTNITAGVAASDTAFASSWNGVTTISPSKNAVYDWGHIFDTDDDGKVNVLDQGVGIAITDSSGVLQTPVTTSALLASALSDETGSGGAVFANGPSLGTFGSSTNANLNFVYVTNNNAFIYSDETIATNSTANTNLTMNVNLGVRTLYVTNNVSLTNFSNLEAGTSKTVTWHIYPQLVNRTIVWPTLGAAGYAIRAYTNANSPMWTTLTNGNCYVLNAEWRNTNVWLSISEWK